MITIPKETKIAKMEQIPDDACCLNTGNTSETSSDHCSTLWKMVDKVDNRLTHCEKEQLYMILLDYSDIFVQSPDNFGQTGEIQHRIDSGHSQSVHQQTWRMPTFQKDEARKLVQEILDKDFIHCNPQRVLWLLQQYSSGRRTDWC